MRALLTALAAGLLLAAPLPALAQEDPDNVVFVDRDDQEMNAARAEARAKLPEFWRRYDAHQEVRSGASLKVGFRQGDEIEYMWVGDIRRAPGGTITGVLNNEPVLVNNVEAGEIVTFVRADVIDWTYDRGGKAWGHFTTRVLLRRAPAEAAKYEGYFSDTPVEP